MSKEGRISVLSSILLFLILLIAFFDYEVFTPFMPRLWYKLLHLLGVFVFFGNVAIGPFWVWYAHKTKKTAHVNFAFDMLIKTDLLVTVPAMILIVLNGVYLAFYYGGIQQCNWLRHTLYDMISLWILVIPIIRYQDKLLVLVKNGELDTVLYKKYYRRWMIYGGISCLPVAHIVYLMVFKRGLF